MAVAAENDDMFFPPSLADNYKTKEDQLKLIAVNRMNNEKGKKFDEPDRFPVIFQ